MPNLNNEKENAGERFGDQPGVILNTSTVNACIFLYTGSIGASQEKNKKSAGNVSPIDDQRRDPVFTVLPSGCNMFRPNNAYCGVTRGQSGYDIQAVRIKRLVAIGSQGFTE